MLAEPKRKQKNAAELNQIVVLNYMLASHTATLAAIARDRGSAIPVPDYEPVIRSVIFNMNKGQEILKSSLQPKSVSPQADAGSTVSSTSETMHSPAAGGLDVKANVVEEISGTNESSALKPNAASEIRGIDDSGDAYNLNFSGSAFNAETPGEIRQVNEQVALLVSKRKSELEQGIRESETGRRITLVKSVNDQFNFIWKISEDLLKILSKVNIFFFLYFIRILKP